MVFLTAAWIVGGEHYLFLANNFEVVSNVDGLLLGTYITSSRIYHFVKGQLVLLESFMTEGAKNIKSFRVGTSTFVVVANNYNDTHTFIDSDLWVQGIPTSSAVMWHHFMDRGASWALVAQEYSAMKQAYVVDSILYRFIGGRMLG
ncbi:hypothetical protein T484DRAFT_1823914 [Baffinella frigidus]|nr:hypothetical protein T484DRAFT_1823914 [Cryptophyta sp. CCMP2293]